MANVIQALTDSYTVIYQAGNLTKYADMDQNNILFVLLIASVKVNLSFIGSDQFEHYLLVLLKSDKKHLSGHLWCRPYFTVLNILIW